MKKIRNLFLFQVAILQKKRTVESTKRVYIVSLILFPKIYTKLNVLV